MSDGRRKWDRDEYEKLAQERLRELEAEDDSDADSDDGLKIPVKRELLKPRDYKVMPFQIRNKFLNATSFFKSNEICDFYLGLYFLKQFFVVAKGQLLYGGFRTTPR